MTMFVDELIRVIRNKETILCVGIDPQVRYIPEHILRQGEKEATNPSDPFEVTCRAFVIFFREIIEAVAPYAAAVKPNIAFFEAYKYWGFKAFEKVVKICRQQKLLVIEDAKRCDGGDTAKAYAQGHLGLVEVWNPRESRITKVRSLDVDAMTVMPWIGEAGLKPFIEMAKEYGKGIFIVNKTSFKPNSAIEQLTIETGLKLWEETAKLVKQWSDGCEGELGINNIAVVVGATYPEEAVRMRELLPDHLFLVPGYGAQGGGADGAIKGIRPDGLGGIVNSSRGIIYGYLRKFQCEPEQFAEAARKAAEFARDDLNQSLEKAKKIPW
ncbi:MAG: orotidine-5'-phosphate decarboxylase [Candidatus Nealsonbacteria bacterium]